MITVLTGRPSQCVFSPATLEKMFRFRHHVFAEVLQWEVATRDGMERDRFDDLDPVYVLSKDYKGTVDGCWRILPTTGPYMLREVFPELLRGEIAPSAPDVWELSRFAVQPRQRNERAQAYLGNQTMQFVAATYQFAQQHEVREYVTVMSVAVERMMSHLGLPLERLGDAKATRVGKVLSVAARVSTDPSLIRHPGTRDTILRALECGPEGAARSVA